MIEICHTFCGVSVQTAAPCAMEEDDQAAQFLRKAETPGIRVLLECGETLPEPAGQFCGRAGEKMVWREGSVVTRQTWDRFRPQAHMAVQYDLTAPSSVRAAVRRADWAWATRTKYLWAGLALNQLLLPFRTLFFHASYVAWDGRGILFTAPSGTGKSTQAALWHRFRGAEIVNGDKAAVSLRETAVIHSIPFSGTSGICGSVSLPLRAVAVLSQAPENTIRAMGPSEAAAALFPNVFVDRTVPEEWTMALNLVLDLVQRVPVYDLACTPDVRAVETLERAMP